MDSDIPIVKTRKLPRAVKPVTIRKSVLDRVRRHKLSTSRLVAEAVGRAVTMPRLLTPAFEERMKNVDFKDPWVRTTISYPPEMRRAVELLTFHTRLSQEEVIRLCIEAFLLSQREV
jgi:hypothetical protein